MVVVVTDEIIVSDYVQMNCADSERPSRVCDIEVCQIQLDGEVKSIDGEWSSVLVKCEQLGKLKAAVMLKTQLSSLEFAERVHV